MLSIKEAYKSFPHSFEPILKGINLDLNKGEFCILVGSNGSGKSTLFKTITGEHSLDSGSIFINGKEITRRTLYQRAHNISTVTQNIATGTIQEMTLLENITLSCMRGKKSHFYFYKNKLEGITAILKELGLGLEKYIEEPLKSLSGGQCQSIATMMAILSKPDLLLLDEHTSALDPKTQNRLMEYTAEQIKQQNMTTLMITHNLADAVRYGDRLIMMHRGKIVFDVNQEAKKDLQIDQLLSLFHRYEDSLLLEGEESVK